MRFFTPFFALLSAVAVVAQDNNAISQPEGGLQVTAGQPITISWTNPSSGTVTIKLQDGTGVTPTDGIVLVSSVPASALTATLPIPANLPPSSSYNFEIIDDTDPTNYNFSDQFSIAGATALPSTISSTATSSSTASSSASSSSSSGSSSSESSSSASNTSSASRTSSQSSSRTSTSATSTATTAAPNSNTNAASSLKVEGALIAMIAGAVAFF